VLTSVARVRKLATTIRIRHRATEMDIMANQIESASDHSLVREMGITDANIELRKKAVGFGADDLTRIAALQDLVSKCVDKHTSSFFNHLSGLEEARAALANRDLLDKARRLKSEHVVAMVSGDYGSEYVLQRVRLAGLYNKVGLEQRLFLGAFHALLRSIGTDVIKHFERKPLEGFEAFMSLKKIAFFDVALIVDAMIFERERTIRRQQEAIRELSTPVLQVRGRLLLLPIIGVIDTLRARLITETLLQSIRSNRAKVVVMDVTGVASIDSKVANHLLQTVTAARLMGAVVIVTGLSSDVAQSLVALGIDLARFNTVGDLQGGIEEAERLLGYRVTQGAPVMLSPSENGNADAEPYGSAANHG
jgi:rsbT co-antagonist protein RsbR